MLAEAIWDLRSTADEFIFKTLECWRWTGKTFPGGRYGAWGGTTAHRFVYLELRGPIPDGMVLDHLCKNTLCVNPWHMEPKTQRANVLAGTSIAAINAVKMRCVAGHKFSKANTYWYRGKRHCRTCQRRRSQAWKAKAA